MLQNQMHCNVLVHKKTKNTKHQNHAMFCAILHLGCSLKKLSNCICVCTPLGFFMVLRNGMLLS